MTADTGAQAPFDEALPSPLRSLRALRADARDAVVALGAQTGAQATTYVASAVDDAITELASSSPVPHAIVIAGSAGGGKSGCAERQRQAAPNLFSDIVEDATHSDRPSEDQADTLARRLAPLADCAGARPERPVLIAANTGMIVQLAAAWTEPRRGHAFDGLIRRLFLALGLPGAPDDPRDALPLDVRVLNLDDRPTSGEGGLLRGMLPMLRPAATGTAFPDERCATCAAIAYCPARANAELLATVGVDVVDRLASRAAVERARQDTPRALWDFLSRMALPDSHYASDEDPCAASARAYRDSDAGWVVSGLVPLTMFRAGGDVGRRVARLDPARQPRRETYDAFAGAGLMPEDDAEPLRRLADHARSAGCDEAAIATAASALAQGVADGADEREWRDAAAHIKLGVAVLLGELVPDDDPAERPFLQALALYERWQRLEADGADTSAVLEEMEDPFDLLVTQLANGLARMFGETHDDRTFLPVRNYDPREASRAFVEFQLHVSTAQPELDRATAANHEGTRLIGYRPMAVSLQLEAGISVNVDLPTYRLLDATRKGLAGGSGDAERTFALRRASEAIARATAESEGVAMLVTDPGTSRRYLVTTQAGLGGRLNLRARAVSE
ncbi:hypothetical protein [Nocardia cerradoensis]|uniref:Uncharacterized protein n=1 Tax=Nocardia cerradoensis TaxID=85688 RepID=A0A231GTP3_9NOCA|nr:hypothetical protein [Nocardia cerradoensis]NKY48396.1 hypothetical protein [Nocardia cerradoensis]OXR39851.1 hypothetical protein B7C42_08075 [Nocardia cerradoensis]